MVPLKIRAWPWHITPAAVQDWQFCRIYIHFLLSCYTFWIYLRSGSLILPMLLHFINNLFVDVLISEPFASLGTFYAALALFGTGSYLLHRLRKEELENTAKQKDTLG